MNYQEKTILIALPLDFIIFGAYSIWLIPQLLNEGIEGIDYRGPVILALVASVLLTIISQILLASFNHKQANLEDVRDKLTHEPPAVAMREPDKLVVHHMISRPDMRADASTI